MKRFLGIITLVAMIFSLISCGSKTSISSNAEDYKVYLDKVEYAKDYMPSIASCGNFLSVVSTYKKTVIFFDVYTLGLFLSYDEEEYNKQKEHIIQNYTFSDESESKSDSLAKVNGYIIKLVEEDYPLETYKMGFLIGTDDNNHRIGYMYYYDFDLDVLDDLDSYVESYFEIP